jgi:hypothetical protein
VNVGGSRQHRRIDFHNRPDEYELPVRPRASGSRDEPDIEPLVDHPEVTQTWPADGGLIDRVWLLLTRLRKVRDIHAARKRVDARVHVPLRFVESLSSGEHHVGRGEE